MRTRTRKPSGGAAAADRCTVPFCLVAAVANDRGNAGDGEADCFFCSCAVSSPRFFSLRDLSITIETSTPAASAPLSARICQYRFQCVGSIFSRPADSSTALASSPASARSSAIRCSSMCCHSLAIFWFCTPLSDCSTAASMACITPCTKLAFGACVLLWESARLIARRSFAKRVSSGDWRTICSTSAASVVERRPSIHSLKRGSESIINRFASSGCVMKKFLEVCQYLS